MALAGPLRPSRAAVATLVASDGRHWVLGRGNASHPGAVPLEQSADRLLRRGGAQHVGHKLRSEVLLLEALAERLHELLRELSLCGSKMTRINARRAIQAAGAASRGTLSTGSIGRHATLMDAWRLHEELDRLVWRQPEQCVRQLGGHACLLAQLQNDVPSLGLRKALVLQLRDRLVRIHREQPFAKLRRELDRAAAATHDSHRARTARSADATCAQEVRQPTGATATDQTPLMNYFHAKNESLAPVTNPDNSARLTVRS